MRNQYGHVYIVTNKNRNVFYIGVTSNLYRRISEHKAGKGSKFTHKYNCNILVYYESFDEIADAIAREKKLKKWNHAWKKELIQKQNPEMCDLYQDLNPW